MKNSPARLAMGQSKGTIFFNICKLVGEYIVHSPSFMQQSDNLLLL